MRPILLYDGHCNLCIKITKTLEIINNNKIKLIPFQSSSRLKLKYGLSSAALTSKIHFISTDGKVFQGSEAIIELTKYFPRMTLISCLFKTKFGKKFYNLLSKNRYKFFGCSNACYISKYSS